VIINIQFNVSLFHIAFLVTEYTYQGSVSLSLTFKYKTRTRVTTRRTLVYYSTKLIVPVKKLLVYALAESFLYNILSLRSCRLINELVYFRLYNDGATTSSIRTLSIMTLRVTTISLKGLFVKLSINDIQHKRHSA
jgi:hypothetical protein